MSDIDKSLSKAELEEKNGGGIEQPEMDRIPSEIFSAIASLSDTGSQAERLARRRDAIKPTFPKWRACRRDDRLDPTAGQAFFAPTGVCGRAGCWN